MGIMLLFTAIGHFKYLTGMTLMIPKILPYREFIVVATGVFEMFAGIMLITGKLKKQTVWSVILFFILILPANINATIHHVNIKEANYTGPGSSYLWFRIPLQLFFILWLYSFYKRSKN